MMKVENFVLLLLFAAIVASKGVYSYSEDESSKVDENYKRIRGISCSVPTRCSSCLSRDHLRNWNIFRQQNDGIVQRKGRSCSFGYLRDEGENGKKVELFLKMYQNILHLKRRQLALLEWKKATNLTTHNSNSYIKESLKMINWLQTTRHFASKYLTFEGLNCSQTEMLRMVIKTSDPIQTALQREKAALSSKIQTIYSKAEVCKDSTPHKCYRFEPGLIKIMAKSRDYNTLLWAWKGWRDAIGPKIREDWYRIVQINNIGSLEHGYSDKGAYWRSSYKVADFERRLDKLWREVEPLYLQLHAYVRYRLHAVYGDKIDLTEPIPAHLLGNMWAMDWTNIFDICKPFKQVSSFDVTKGMKEKNFTVNKMFHLADDFYRSMGLPPMPTSFWKYSMFTRPQNRSVVCYASAHNLEGTDVRIKMCAEVNQNYLYVVHHEMGHCQYYLAYNTHQPELFQGGANHGFHEAIGDTAALAVISPTHLRKLNLVSQNNNQSSSYERKINFLMKKALQKIAFYPFALSLAKWRWNVFRETVSEADLNGAWWGEKLKYQGIKPPVPRSESDFDPGSKYHVTYGVPYIRYFISFVIQFQFYEALCDLSGHKGELHLCDFAGSKKAGARFEEMLRLGKSKHWEDALKTMTGSCHMSTSSMKKYFRPLIDWLEKENERLGNKLGWN